MRTIRNYTSTQDHQRSIAMIEERLVSFGALAVQKNYDEGEIRGIAFTIREPGTGQLLPIQLPANDEAVFVKLKAQRKRSSYLTAAQQRNLREQARRTAWKLMLDWVDVQLTLVAMAQADLAQVFLPYVTLVGGKSVYHALRERQFLALPSPAGPPDEAIDAEFESR
jgi:hypothetical protein